MMRSADTREAGFTLVETLVAFVILSGTIIVALSVMTESLHRMQRAAQIQEANKVALTALDFMPNKSFEKPVVLGGEQKGLSWRMTVTPLSANTTDMTYPVFVKVIVDDKTKRPVSQSSMETIKIVRRSR